ncbi:hypothetical protein [Oceanobacter antarcticus]|uniref:Uncharacterized protein n=1 Tax=Oceanobacter antarcticus TaxID=3133425 RepID=A0ABW8NIL5_9GAMM
MSIDRHMIGVDDALCKRVLTEMLNKYLSPAFGALPSKEVELIVLEALEKVDFIPESKSQYDLISQLKITKTKARNLIYNQELRRMDKDQLDNAVKTALKSPVLQKQGDLFVLEIENPLVIDHLRSELKNLGHASDGSFSPSLVKISLPAATALIEKILTRSDKRAVKAALVAAGAPDGSFSGVLKGTIKAVAKKVASDSGEQLAENISNYLSPIIDGATEIVADTIGDLFEGEEE